MSNSVTLLTLTGRFDTWGMFVSGLKSLVSRNKVADVKGYRRSTGKYRRKLGIGREEFNTDTDFVKEFNSLFLTPFVLKSPM